MSDFKVSGVNQQENVTEEDVYIDLQDEKGNVHRKYPYTRYDNLLDVPEPSDTKRTPVKMYQSEGNDPKGAWSQKGLSERFQQLIEEANAETVLELQALALLAMNPYIVDDETGTTYKIGSKNDELYFEPIDREAGVQAIIEQIQLLTEIVMGS